MEQMTIMEGWTILGMIIVGLVDLWLYFTKRKTISQRIHAFFPKWTDALIMVGLLVWTWMEMGPLGFILVMLGVIIGHLFWQE